MFLNTSGFVEVRRSCKAPPRLGERKDPNENDAAKSADKLTFDNIHKTIEEREAVVA